MPGTLYVVATPIGNLEDITTRALRVLRDVKLIAAEDTRRTAHLLARYKIATPTTSLHEHNETRKAPDVIARLARGDDVALVCDAGTPLISDPGLHLVQSAIAAGVRIEPIPGPSAITAALAASGLPTQAFTFLGFPPVRSKDRELWFKRMHAAASTVVFFEAPHRIRATLERIQRDLGDRHIVVCKEMTKIHEQLVRGPISEVIRAIGDTKGELTVVIDICHITNNLQKSLAGDAEIFHEFGQITDSGEIPRRLAINILARKHARAPNDIYQAVERGKKSVK